MKVNPQLADSLRVGTFSRLRKLRFKFRLWITLETDPAVAIGEFRCFSSRQGKDITELYK